MLNLLRARDLSAVSLLRDDRELPHLSPARHEHINPYGRYNFEAGPELAVQTLRPLRES